METEKKITPNMIFGSNPFYFILEKYRGQDIIFRACNECIQELHYLQILWQRYHNDVQECNRLSKIYEKLLLKSKDSIAKDILFSEDESDELNSYNYAEISVQLDHDSFIVFAKILMDNVARLAKRLLKREGIPDDFYHQREWLLKSDPIGTSEKYITLVREQTDWFNGLKESRDNIVSHPVPRVKISYVGKGRFARVGRLGNFLQEHNELLEMKKKYYQEYPELEHENWLWGIINFFTSNDIKLSSSDRNDFNRIYKKVGGELPPVDYLAERISAFTDSFVKAFVS